MKKFLVITVVIALLCSMLVVPAFASGWKTGNFGGGYTTVYLTNNKTGYIRIHTYNCTKGNHSGACWGTGETSGKIHVKLCDLNGRYITEFNTTGGTKLKLGNDHSGYRIYISCRQDLGSANNFTNLGKCTHWAIETVSNTCF